MVDEESSSSCGSVTSTATPPLQQSSQKTKSQPSASSIYPVDKPFFCYVDEKLNKCCKSCKVECRYQIETLLSNHINQQDINKELKEHGHPSSRKIEGRYRLTNEARQELIEHYRYSHGYGLAPNGQNFFSYANIDRSATPSQRKSNSRSNNNTPNVATPSISHQVANQPTMSTQQVKVSHANVVNSQKIEPPSYYPPVSQSEPSSSPIVQSPAILNAPTSTSRPVMNTVRPQPPESSIRREQCEFFESQSTLQLIEHYKYAYGLILEQD